MWAIQTSLRYKNCFIVPYFYDMCVLFNIFCVSVLWPAQTFAISFKLTRIQHSVHIAVAHTHNTTNVLLFYFPGFVTVALLFSTRARSALTCVCEFIVSSAFDFIHNRKTIFCWWFLVQQAKILLYFCDTFNNGTYQGRLVARALACANTLCTFRLLYSQNATHRIEWSFSFSVVFHSVGPRWTAFLHIPSLESIASHNKSSASAHAIEDKTHQIHYFRVYSSNLCVIALLRVSYTLPAMHP